MDEKLTWGPHLTYASSAWGYAAKPYLKKLQAVKNIVLRTALNTPWYSSNKAIKMDLKYQTMTFVIYTCGQKFGNPDKDVGPVRDAKRNQGVGPKQRGRKEKKEKRRTIQKKEESEEDENEDMEKELDFKKILQKQVKEKQKQNKVSASRVADTIPSARKLDGIRIRPNRLNDTTPSPNKSNGTEAGPSGLADTTPGPNRLDSISQNQSQTNKAQRIPPIVINNANNWTTRRNRALARLLKEEKKELHTFSLPEDKKVRAVVGRISESLTEEETLEDLKGQGINPISVQRMKSRKDKKALPLVLVQVTIQWRLCHASGKTRHESEIGHQTSQMARKVQTFKKRDDDEKPKLLSLGEIRRLEKEEGKTSSSHKMAELGGKISGNTEMALSIEEYCQNPEMLFEMNQHLYQKNLAQSKEINEFKETNQRLLTALKKMEARLDKLENSSAEEKETKRKKKTLKETDSERETEQSDEEMNTVDLRQIQNEQRKERKAEIEKRGKEEKERQKPKEKVDQILQLKEENKEFNTYSLPEDKKVRAVIGLLSENVTEEEVQRDLSGQGIETFSVQRMRSRVDKRTLPLMLVQMEPKDKEKIFNLTRCCDLSVRVEAQRMQPGPNQCHRGQKFGHSQRFCTAQPKCVKCGEGHLTEKCQKAKTVPPKCANCGGPHPASYRGCKNVPQLPKPKKEMQNKPAMKEAPTPTPFKPGTSYASVTRKEPKQKTPSTTMATTKKEEPVDFQQALKQMQMMYSAMTLQIISWNINGIKERKAELQKLIQRKNPDVVAIQETRLRPTEHFKIPRYETHRKDNENQRETAHGGTALLVRDNIQHAQLPPIETEEMEAMAIEVNTTRAKDLSAINGTENTDEIEEAISTFKRDIKTALNTSSKIVRKQRIRNCMAQIPEEIKRLIQQRRQAKKRAFRTNTSADKNSLNRLNRRATVVQQKIREKQWQEHLESLNPENKSMWKTFKAIKSKRKPIPPIHRE
ncbi:mRNA export factor GLE1-like [Euwallacea fornicatus]|uniref:mRNA export factor GLE1-like n=1 Tax=Euwallacea fornicatus TaxID=995702 RepID=UPI00338FFE6D